MDRGQFRRYAMSCLILLQKTTTGCLVSFRSSQYTSGALQEDVLHCTIPLNNSLWKQQQPNLFKIFQGFFSIF